MDLSISSDGGSIQQQYMTEGRKMSIWPPQASTQSRPRRGARRELTMKTKTSARRIERQQPRTRVSTDRHEKVFTAIAAATMLTLLPVCKSLASLDSRFAKYILLPNRQSSMDKGPVQTGFQLSSPVESRLPRDREDPCSFRTRLIDPVADYEADLDFESTDKLGGDDLKFDDTQCISVGRSEHCDTSAIHKTLSDPTAAYRTVLINDNDDGGDGDNMEAMNMPFWNLPKRQRRHTHYAGDTIPDDMSIISDVSLIPTYFPSDIMKQQQQRPQHRTLIKRLIRAKARAARQTMRELKRSCRDAVGNVFVEPAAHRAPKCVAVGSGH
ncbi:hypothetical protein C8A00DRAFT_11062 [Chaetomidium leptoderma]|uniref:Uncharacterized protein n=1 Tax=Chaetomidium leptoderma TaxID=669021 RepID=A0AAN6VUT1_9PEZI|nr:hypothetical protein C8A00DRAFT_11062 [Chaetomidium leptoderma]